MSSRKNTVEVNWAPVYIPSGGACIVLEPEVAVASEAGAIIAPQSEVEQPRVRMNLLVYVHLRNIHGSTGAGRVARQLVEHLQQRSDVQLRILADPADHTRVIPRIGIPWDTYDYHFIGAETSRQQARWFFFDSPRAESYWPDAQIVFCTAESYVPTAKARLAVTLHDAAYFEKDAHPMDNAFALQRLKWRLLYGKLASKADLFHTVSHFSAERLAHFFPAIRSRIRVVHNAVAPHFFGDVSAAAKTSVEELGLNARPFILLPGGLHFRKNAALVFDTWPLLKARYPDLVLAVVNHSDPRYVEKAKTFGPDFRIIGFVPDPVLKALYAAALVVWFPSKYEGFGLPVLEAMACGAPVLASNSSSLPEIAGDAALLASPNLPEEHLELLVAILGDHKLRADLCRRGKDRASLFTWESSAAQLKTHFESLL